MNRVHFKVRSSCCSSHRETTQTWRLTKSRPDRKREFEQELSLKKIYEPITSIKSQGLGGSNASNNLVKEERSKKMQTGENHDNTATRLRVDEFV